MATVLWATAAFVCGTCAGFGLCLWLTRPEVREEKPAPDTARVRAEAFLLGFSVGRSGAVSTPMDEFIAARRGDA